MGIRSCHNYVLLAAKLDSRGRGEVVLEGEGTGTQIHPAEHQLPRPLMSVCTHNYYTHSPYLLDAASQGYLSQTDITGSDNNTDRTHTARCRICQTENILVNLDELDLLWLLLDPIHTIFYLPLDQ